MQGRQRGEARRAVHRRVGETAALCAWSSVPRKSSKPPSPRWPGSRPTTRRAGWHHAAVAARHRHRRRERPTPWAASSTACCRCARCGASPPPASRRRHFQTKVRDCMAGAGIPRATASSTPPSRSRSRCSQMLAQDAPLRARYVLIPAQLPADLAVPSAVVPAERNYLINPRHPDFARIVIGVPKALMWMFGCCGIWA